MMYPQVDAGFSAQRQRFNPIILGQDGKAREFSLFNASVNVNYQLDLVGGNHRALEALAAETEYRHPELEGAQLTLAGNIVTAAITQARLAAQIQSTEAILRAQDGHLHITQERVRLGQGAPDEVLALETQVNRLAPDFCAAQTDQQMNICCHSLPCRDGRLPAFTLENSLTVRFTLNVRFERCAAPRILGAEALVHAVNAEYGSCIRNLILAPVSLRRP
jgi:hypothetical protein